MDRNETLLLIQKANSGYLGLDDVSKTVIDYCIEKGKNVLLAQQFVRIMSSMGRIMEPFSIALEYFQKKFGICTLTDAKGKVILTF